MGRTIRFLGRYSAQTALIFAAFGVIVVAGCWFTGTLDGLFGTYAQVFFNFSIMFSMMTGLSLDSYMNVALAMGAQRSRCFWAAELCSAVNVLLVIGLAAWVRWATAALPCGEERWIITLPDGWIWALMLAAGLFFSQVSLLVARIERPRWRTAGMLILMLLCACCSIGLMLFCMLDSLAWLGRLLNGLLVGFLLGTVAAGALAYRIYRKAVVRV